VVHLKRILFNNICATVEIGTFIMADMCFLIICIIKKEIQSIQRHRYIIKNENQSIQRHKYIIQTEIQSIPRHIYITKNHTTAILKLPIHTAPHMYY